MKRLITFLLIVFNTLLLSAQSHITFKGIPVDGHVSAFVEKMEKIGYTLYDKYESGYVMRGSFTGKDATIYVMITPKTKTVWKVCATIDKKENNWETLKNKYLEYKQNYINKYGEPEHEFHFFMSPYSEGDGKEIQAIEEDKCCYACYFRLEGGTIRVNISNFKTIDLGYEDAINVKILEAEHSSMIYDDI